MGEGNVAPVLEDLIETLEDGHRGFSEAADQLAEHGEHELATELREYGAQRARFSSELRDLGVARSLLVDRSGTLAGRLHRGWMSLTESFSADKRRRVLGAVERGEDHARSQYERALSQSLPDDFRIVISRQASEIESVYERVRALRDMEHA